MHAINEDDMYDAMIEQEAIEVSEITAQIAKLSPLIEEAKALGIKAQIAELSPLMPAKVLQDVDKRITGWLAGGGKYTDEYIKQQVRYMQHVARALGKETVP